MFPNTTVPATLAWITLCPEGPLLVADFLSLTLSLTIPELFLLGLLLGAESISHCWVLTFALSHQLMAGSTRP